MVKEKVLDLANHISNKKRGSKNEIKATDPEYMILEPVVSEEMAEVVLCMEIRKKVTAKDVAPLCGKSVERTTELLLELADAGVCFVNEIDGVETFWYEAWVPGIMKMPLKVKLEEHPMRKFLSILMIMIFFQLLIVHAVQQEKLWEKAAVILRKTCAFRWVTQQNTIYVRRGANRLLVKKPLKLLREQKKTA